MLGNIVPSDGEKVYWVKGSPNNGWGTLLFKVPFVKWYIVKDRTGRIVAVDTVFEIKETLKHKENIVQELKDVTGALREIRNFNKKEIAEGLEFLYKDEK